MKTPAFFALASFIVMASPAAGQDEQSPSWHLLTMSEGGTVSLLKGLSKHECEFARNRAMRLPATDEEKIADGKMREGTDAKIKAWADDHHRGTVRTTSGTSFGSKNGVCFVGVDITGMQGHVVEKSDIETAECFQ